jgi:DMSO/TMAO reductase YedYZ molybdopterin-dependent catalytic subunit
MTKNVGVVRQMRRWWPRRAEGLPPGQRALDEFPRFADDPRRPPPSTDQSVLSITSADGGEVRIPLDEVRSSALGESRVADFHCVTTWTARGQTWTGVPLAAWWMASIGPLPSEPFAVIGAADGYRAVFRTDDLFADDVMLAWGLNGDALDQRHGVPLRLISPAQYGYKNVKHVESIAFHTERPDSLLGPKEHLRARVALEERHSRIPGRLLRWPYRVVVPITAVVAERTLREESGDTIADPGAK